MPPTIFFVGDGRAVRPKWSLADRLAVLAYETYVASLCEGCNQRRERSFNPEMAENYQVHPHPCYGCKQLEEASSKQKNAKGMKNYLVDAGGDLPDYTIRLRPIDPEMYAEIND